MVHTVRAEMGDTLNVEIFQKTSLEEKHEATLVIGTAGLIEVQVTRHSPDLVVVTVVE